MDLKNNKPEVNKMKNYFFTATLILVVIIVGIFNLRDYGPADNNEVVIFIIIAGVILLLGLLINTGVHRLFPQPTQSSSSAPSLNNNLTADQQKFVDSWSMGGYLGPWYLILSNANKNIPWTILFPFQLIRNGRRIVWDTGVWPDFDSYKKRQLRVDQIGLIVLVAPILMFIAVMFYILWT